MLKMKLGIGAAITMALLTGEVVSQDVDCEDCCYGYGNLMGDPSNFLEDDYDVVTENLVG